MQQVQQPQPKPKLTAAEKEQWNSFVDFLDQQKVKGSNNLDDRNKNLGMALMQKYKQLNPKSTLDYSRVQQVQQELQDYRNDLVTKWKTGKVAPIGGVKSEMDIMPNLSQVDGWLGSKTSSNKFPIATYTTGDGTKKDFGTNVALYDAMINANNKRQ